jgi:magnesium transporter
MLKKGAGLPPGSPVYIGKREPTQSLLSIYSYDQDGWKSDCPSSVASLFDAVEEGKTNWINVNGLTGGVVERLCERLGIHALVVEDILNTEHRPAVESYDDYLFVITKMLTVRDDGSIEYEQVSLIVKGGIVVTIQETPGDCFGPIRERISTGAGRIRRSGSDYLAYGLLDIIVDNYFLVLEGLGDRLEALELGATDPAEARIFMAELQSLKGELLRMRRTIWPVRDSIGMLLRLEGGRLSPGLDPFLRDLYENSVQVIEAVETYREQAESILEIYLSSVSNRMNEVMKVLTVISTIFIPLTFLAGVYGMNFQYMPELSKPWAYPALWVLMALIAGAMLLFFKRKKWF